MPKKEISDAQKAKWKEERDEKLKNITAQLQTLIDGYEENPETIAELLSFSGKFYQYSYRNTCLIYQQNPNCTYVQSFLDWKKAGYPVKAKEKGIKILVPVKATYLDIGNASIPLSIATSEQKQAFKAGQIPYHDKIHFSTGNVFDISQTICPPEQYPKFYSMGYQDENSSLRFKGLCDYAKEHLNTIVKIEDMQSISLRGTFSVFPIHEGFHKIQINALLKDSEALSTLSHEIGHSVIHKRDLEKSTTVKELEADCFAVMLQSHMGVDLTESRKRHLTHHFKDLQSINETNVQNGEAAISFESILSRVFDLYSQELPEIDQCVKQALSNRQNAHNPATRYCQSKSQSISPATSHNIEL